MARSISIKFLGLRNMFKGAVDSVCFIYDDSKSDKKGAKESIFIILRPKANKNETNLTSFSYCSGDS